MTGIKDRRSFPRRKLDLPFNLIINGEPAPAVVTDFSLYGMAILIKGRSALNVTVLDLNISDINLNATGKILWKREMFAGLKVGVIRLGPLDGRLDYYSLSDIVLGIARTRRTGVLVIDTEQWQKKIYFKAGDMVYSASDQDNEQLGALLLAEGRITPEQYHTTLSLAQKSGKNQGAVLVEMRYLDPQELVQAVYRRVEAVIMNLCNSGSARFSFREGPLPVEEILMLKLNSDDLLYRGSKNSDCIDTFKRRYLHHGTRIALPSEIMDYSGRLELDAQDREILSLINGRTSLIGLLSASKLKEEDTLRSVYALFNARLLEVEVDKTEEESRDQEIKLEDRASDPALTDRIDTLYRRYKTLGYHGVLGLLPGATSAEIKSAYHAMAKEYHPDRYLLLGQDEKIREKLNVVFAYINEAYRELSRSGGIKHNQSQTSVAHQETRGTDSKSMAMDRYWQGRESFSNQNYADAMILFGQAVYLDASVPDYHYYYGATLLRNKKIREAEASIRQALHLSPSNADYYAELGNIYLKLGFMTRAKNAFDKALRLDPSHADAAKGLKEILGLQKG